MATLIQTARPTAVPSATAETELGALSWFASMLAAFGLLSLTLVRDRIVSWFRPALPPAAPPARRRAANASRPPYVTRCGRPPAR